MSSFSLLVRRASSRRATRIIPTAFRAAAMSSRVKVNDKTVVYPKDCENPEMTKLLDSMQLRAQQNAYAVDAPDGMADASIAEEIEQINKMMNEAAEHKEEIKARGDEMIARMREAYAVDAPDGEVDGHFKEELEEVKHIIDEAGTSLKTGLKKDQTKENLSRNRADDIEYW